MTMFRIKKILGPFGVLFFLILLLAAGCGAPKLDDDFLREEGGSSDSFIAEEIPDSGVIKRIDSLNSEIADLESLFRKISDKDLVSRMDSLLREINEIKRNISTPVQNDYSKLDSLEKAG